MGTRNITAVVLNGELRISQYCQWDGGTRNKGADVVKFIKKNIQHAIPDYYKYKLEEFKKHVDLTESVTEEYIQQLNSISDTFLMVNPQYSIPLKVMFPQFCRDTGVKVLDIINDIQNYELGSKKFPVEIETNVMGIEFIYILDLDNEQLYILTTHDFKGRQQTVPQFILDFFKIKSGFRCWYKEHLNLIPDIDTLCRIKNSIGLDCYKDDENEWHDY